MLFNSAEFLIFFPAVCLLYFVLPHRWRWALLLAASYYFYMSWRWEYIFIIVFSTGIDYFCGLQMMKQPTKKRRKPYLWLSLLSNLGILFTFKYYNFFATEVDKLAEALNIAYASPTLQWLLPMGISFYTFQTMSYSIDIYNDRIKAEKHLGIFALFVTFFPQLVAGPIERASNLLPQFRKHMHFSYENAVWGITKITYGFFKKVVVADRLAVYVDAVYSNPAGADSGTVILATFFFAVQIYCDFSGYSDIAIGCAKILGFDLMENFRRPYLAKSISEFWKRWHISLSTWFRDYCYIPLGGNRVVKWRWYYNLMITFLVSGFWHGAEWTFIIWGGLHGAYLVAAILLEKQVNAGARALGLYKIPKLNTLLNVLLTCGLAVFAWIFFRANNLPDALTIIQTALDFNFQLSLGALTAGTGSFNLVISVLVVGLLGLSYLLPYHLKLKYPRTFIVVTTMVIVLLGRNGDEFIYFQF